MKRLFLAMMFSLMVVSLSLAAQHDYVLENNPGVTFRADLNSVLSAIVSNNSGATAPAVLFPNMWWYDTSTSLLKRRNNANDAWITLGLEAADTDGTLSANSDSKIATQKATKTYADTKAEKGANSSITSLSGLTTALSRPQGGLGTTSGTAYGVIANGTTSTGATQSIDPGTSGQVLTSNGPSALPSFQAVSVGLGGMQVFTSSGTFTKPAGVTKVLVELVGGGGGGYNLGGKGGGGGGGYAKKLCTITGNVTITVGTGGATGAPGSAGGTTSFGSDFSATGGGAGGNGSGGAGGSGSGGDLNFAGGAGGSTGTAPYNGLAGNGFAPGGGSSSSGTVGGYGVFGIGGALGAQGAGYGSGGGTDSAGKDGIAIVYY